MAVTSGRWCRSGGAAIAALALTACVTMRVGSFVERGTEFTRYRTYSWEPIARAATGDPRLDNNELVEGRIRSAVDRQMARHGFEETSATADLLLHYHASVTQRVDPAPADVVYRGCADCTPTVYDAGTLVLDVVDARSRTLVWRAWAEAAVDGVIDDQALLERKIDEAVGRMFATLPR